VSPLAFSSTSRATAASHGSRSSALARLRARGGVEVAPLPETRHEDSPYLRLPVSVCEVVWCRLEIEPDEGEDPDAA
jgi:hypothetical protein